MKPKKIELYIAKELFLTWFSVSFVLVAILLVNRFIKFLSQAANGELPADLVAVLLAYKAIEYFPLLLPFTLFIGAMLTLGRLGRDNEMTVMLSCGIGPSVLYRAISFVVVPLFALVFYLSVYLSPWAVGAGTAISENSKVSNDISAIEVGRFTKGDSGKEAFYAQERDAENDNLKDVFLRHGRDGQTVVVLADSASYEEKHDSRYMVFRKGYRYEGIIGEKQWNITSFGVHGVDAGKEKKTTVASEYKAKEIAELYSSKSKRDIAEFHWRLAMPLMLLLLAFSVLPLGKVSPREGRFGRLFAAILIYFAYLKLLTLGRGLIEKGSIPSFAGLWWVHIIFIVFAVFLYWRTFGFGETGGRKVGKRKSA
ncbi:MAG: LPS export ABC transporter permease LptF [Gammaproteobacteria bacterium]|nr:MAG: LPS export ABC transporter permease LptF [Gammaproteobacteria bacterium]